MKSFLEQCEKIFTIIKRLRGKGGCPWDIEQTPYTMRESIIEESYEVLEAISTLESSTAKSEQELTTLKEHVKEELGDLLFNVLMVSYMFEQEGSFTVSSVVQDVAEKIVRRHPHVFGQTEGFEGPESEKKPLNATQVLSQWELIKQNVEKRKTALILDSVPQMSPLLRAQKMQKKASKVGFDFANVADVRKKLSEELDELDEVVVDYENPRIEDNLKLESEIGDVLFSVVNVARVLKVNAELALQGANKKFESRFSFVESEMQKEGKKLCKEEMKKMDELWEQAKFKERKNEKP